MYLLIHHLGCVDASIGLLHVSYQETFSVVHKPKGNTVDWEITENVRVAYQVQIGAFALLSNDTKICSTSLVTKINFHQNHLLEHRAPLIYQRNQLKSKLLRIFRIVSDINESIILDPCEC